MKYGLSNFSIIPMRAESTDLSEMVNQILFGEQYKIIKSIKKFSKIRLSHDNYEGWICNKQWLEIEEETYKILDKEVSTISMLGSTIIHSLFLCNFHEKTPRGSECL